MALDSTTRTATTDTNPTTTEPMMRAIVQDSYGSAEVLRPAEITRPEIADDEVLLRVHAAGLDRGTWHLMTGTPYLMRIIGFGFRRPKNRVPGVDVAGTVVAVGSAVTRFAVGDEVFGMSRGSFAEYAAAREDKLAHKPANVSFEQAAVVGISGGTALQALTAGRVQAGTAGADHRRLRRRRQLRGAAGQGRRRRGHRGVQHRKARPGHRSGCRPRRRLHPGGLRRRRAPLRPDHRHRRQLAAVPAPAGAHPAPGPPSSSAARARAT